MGRHLFFAFAFVLACGSPACSGSPPAAQGPAAVATAPPAPSATVVPAADRPPIDLPACPGPAPAPDAAGAAPRQVVQGRHTDAIEALAFAPDGTLATLGKDFSLRYWDVRARFLLRSTRLQTMPHVGALTWDRRGEHVTVVGWKSRDAFDLGGRRADDRRSPLAFPPGVAEPKNPFDVWIYTAAAAPTVAAIVQNKKDFLNKAGPSKLLVWGDPGNGQPARTLAVDDPTTARLTEAGDTLAYTVVDPGENDVTKVKSRLFLASATDATAPAREVYAVTGWLRLMAVAEDKGSALVTVQRSQRGDDEELALIDLATQKPRWSRPVDVEDERGARSDGGHFALAAMSPTDPILALTTKDGRLQLFDARNGRYRGTLGHKVRPVGEVLFLSDDTLAAVSPWTDNYTEGRVSLWSVREGAVTQRVEVPSPRFVGAFSNGDLVVARTKSPRPRCGKNGHELAFDRWEGAVASPTPRAGAPFDVAPRCVEDALFVAAMDYPHARALVNQNPIVAGRGKPRDVILDLRTGAIKPIEGDTGPGGGWFSPDGRWIAAFGRGDEDLAWYLWDARTGKRLRHAFGIKREGDGKLQLSAAAFSPEGGRLAVAHKNVISIRDIGKNSEVLHIDAGGAVGALAYGATAAELYVASDGDLGLYRDGKRVAQGTSDGGAILSVERSPGGGLLATTSGDGSVRLWDAKTMRLLAALAEFGDDEYIAFTPAGAYAGTTEVADRVGFVFDHPLEGSGFEQFSSAYHKPEIVRRRLRGEAIDIDAITARPPRVTKVSADAGADAHARVRAHAASSRRVDSVRAYADGRPVAAAALCRSDGDVELDVPLLPGNNRITLTAFDDRGFSSNPVTVDVPSRGSPARRPDVWVVAAGVSTYPALPAKFQLAVANDDARAVAAAFQDQAGEGRPYAASHVKVLTDLQVTVEAVKAALAPLATMQPDDVAIVFFSGHGVKPAPDEDMVFLTSASDMTPESARATGVGWAMIGDLLQKARGRVVVLLDACHAGHVTQRLVVPNSALAGALTRSGRAGALVFAASKGRQESFEVKGAKGIKVVQGDPRAPVASADAHGFFTGALLRSLESASTDRDGDGSIELSELVEDVTARVTRVSRGMQTPWVARREMFGDFGIAAAHK